MKQHLLSFFAAILLGAACSLLAFGQVITTGSLSGAVTDPSAAVVPNAMITVKNDTTGEEFTAATADNGTFTVPALAAGTYTVTVTATGFKRAVLRNIKVDVGKPSGINVTLEVGAVDESVTIVVGGGELLHTQTATVSTTITGRQITELPFASRDASDLVLLLPGTQTPGRPRSSTVNGLPKGALNITIDGVNVQNLNKSGEGFFTFIRPRIDAVEEVTVSSATPGAESAAEGAVQIKFVTRQGTNDFRGSLYWYHRNPALNANYYFNNRDLPPDPRTGKAPRNRTLLNQPGFRVGGPIRIPGLYNGRDRAFFFVNYEEFYLPEQQLRQRTILSPQAQAGVFQYNSAGGVRSVNLLALAEAAGQTSTLDPTVAQVLADIRRSTSRGGVEPLTDPNQQRFSYISTGNLVRRFPTVRLDFNLTRHHHLENIWNYQKFYSAAELFNNQDPAFPGFPNPGGQYSNRFSNVVALRSTFSPRLVNEARFGLLGGTNGMRPDVAPAQFVGQGGFAIGTDVGSTTTGFGLAGISNPTASRTALRRNFPIKQFTDTLTYIRGQHSFNFGGSFSQINLWQQNFAGGVVPTLTFGFATGDPAASLFTAANFPDASNADLTRASNLYAILTGRIISVAARAFLDEQSGQYQYLGPFVDRLRQREFGLFAQDSWRMRPNLTVTYGLRWEVQYPFTALNDNYAETTRAGLFGVSGEGNLFKPGTLAGQFTEFTQFKAGDKAYHTNYKNFAPSIGVAWSPEWKSGPLHRIFGDSGQSVIRAGYSIAFVREGMSVPTAILGANPGGSVNLTRSIARGNLTPGTLLRDRSSLTTPAFPSSPSYPLRGAATDSANVFDPDLKMGYVQSWSLGVQREITKDMVLEARYTGTRGTRLWRRYDLNEVNVIENGFLDEFRLAQANLHANIAAGRFVGQNRLPTFAYYGPNTGTFPLPIILAHFSGSSATPVNPASYTSANFTSTTFIAPLSPNNANPTGFANSLGGPASPAGFRNNAASAGLPRNFFMVNPDYLGGAFILDNGGHTWYDALTLELRRRFSAGLLVQASYTFSKSLTNMYASNDSVTSQPASLRFPHLDKTTSPFDIRHALKANWIYELPVGRGKALLDDAGELLDRVVSGWAIHGTARIQSGTPFSFGNVQLVNMTREELQSLVKIRKHPDKIVYYLPDDVILNTRRAFNVTAAGFSALGAPTGKYIAPASSNGCAQAYTGECGFTNLVLYGPCFTRFDLSLVKRIRLTEDANLELRGEFLNAFNNINFKVGSPDADVTIIDNFSRSTFGQTTFAYQDNSTTNDPGGRLVQFVLRFNF